MTNTPQASEGRDWGWILLVFISGFLSGVVFLSLTIWGI